MAPSSFPLPISHRRPPPSSDSNLHRSEPLIPVGECVTDLGGSLSSSWSSSDMDAATGEEPPAPYGRHGLTSSEYFLQMCEGPCPSGRTTTV
ncbi:hypothetical protein EJB05_57671 [Eragrostis curvula]|uniref:Uncharacterized protein n=1 Tax=Eragrostis curvula TaxID=38414 RepID=A0A5J9SCV5_9POAL|nr:hypothetical protein EJB05_57671 [Eragrostis curvula]